MAFLILRTRAADTLAQLENLRSASALLGLQPEDLRCPTIRTERRVGRQRARVEIEVPVLGNFLFARWDGSVYWANYVERQFPFVSVMRLPHGGYATCSEKEVDAINKLPPIPVPEGADGFEWEIGDLVVVREGPFLAGVEGEVVRIKKNGEVVLRVTNNKGLKLTTLLLHGSLLTINVNASV